MFSGFMVNAWEVANIVAVVAGAVGFFTVLRGSAFEAHAIPNGSFAGAAGASGLRTACRPIDQSSEVVERPRTPRRITSWLVSLTPRRSPTAAIASSRLSSVKGRTSPVCSSTMWW